MVRLVPIIMGGGREVWSVCDVRGVIDSDSDVTSLHSPGISALIYYSKLAHVWGYSSVVEQSAAVL